MAITPEQARAELARRELARRELARRQTKQEPDTALNRAADFVQPVTDVLGAIGQAGEKLNNLAPYNPISILNRINSGVMAGAANLGEKAATGLATKGVNPYAAATAGMGITMAPAIAQGIAAPSIPQAGIESALASGERAAAQAVLPRTLKTTAGIPEKATEALINDPGLLKRLGGTPESVAAKMQEVQGLVTQAKQRIGSIFGKIQKRYTGLDSPMDDFHSDLVNPSYVPVIGKRSTTGEATTETTFKSAGRGSEGDAIRNPITGETSYVDGSPGAGLVGTTREIPGKSNTYTDVVDTRIANQPKRTLRDIALDYEAAKRGDLLKEVQTGTGVAKPLPVKQQLAKLTQLKRELQAQANYNQNPITLKPIDTVVDADIKRMAGEINDLRSKVSPEAGKNLNLIDDAWKDIRDIYGTIQKDLADPGKAKDTFMRIMKGDSTWLTSGKFENKLNAIRKVEKITGQDILEPALKELTSMTFKQPYGKGIGYHTAPVAAITLGAQQLLQGNIGAGLAGLGSGVGMVTAGSPRLLGLGISNAARAAKYLNKGPAFGASQLPKINLGFGKKKKRE